MSQHVIVVQWQKGANLTNLDRNTFHLPSLQLTASLPLKIGHPKRKQSSSNHPFSGANCLLVSGRVMPWHLQLSFMTVLDGCPRLPLYHGGFLYDVEVIELQMEVVFSMFFQLLLVYMIYQNNMLMLVHTVINKHLMIIAFQIYFYQTQTVSMGEHKNHQQNSVLKQNCCHVQS